MTTEYNNTSETIFKKSLAKIKERWNTLLWYLFWIVVVGIIITVIGEETLGVQGNTIKTLLVHQLLQ